MLSRNMPSLTVRVRSRTCEFTAQSGSVVTRNCETGEFSECIFVYTPEYVELIAVLQKRFEVPIQGVFHPDLQCIESGVLVIIDLRKRRGALEHVTYLMCAEVMDLKEIIETMLVRFLAFSTVSKGVVASR